MVKNQKLASPGEELLGMHQEMLSRALRSYWGNLKASIRARRYLKERGITAESIRRFGIGYADRDSRGLRSAFPNYHVQSLVDCGLVIDGERGRFDRFRDRIMFPILNDVGRVIAFGGRIIDGDGAKYLNSPQTALFDKGATLYGLKQAQASIEESGEAIVMEGYMDVVMSSQNGIHNVVAALGTATTQAHVKKLIAVAKRRIVFCFDGDAAGLTAAERAMEACVEVVSPGSPEIAFAFLPAGEDPDSFVRQHGAEKFKEFIAQAATFETFLLEHLRAEKDLGTCEGRANMASLAVDVLARIRDAGVYYRLCEAVSRDTGLSVVELIVLSDSEKQRIWHPAGDADQATGCGKAGETSAEQPGGLRVA